MKSEMKRCSIEEDAFIESCWEIRVLMREKKGVIPEFENWGGGKVLMMVERSGSAARRWLSAAVISFCDDNVGVRRGKCDFSFVLCFLWWVLGFFLAGKEIFEEIRGLMIGGCGLVMDLISDRVRFMGQIWGGEERLDNEVFLFTNGLSFLIYQKSNDFFKSHQLFYIIE